MSKDNKNAGKVIITCAVTGAIHTPSMSPYLPVSPEEIISDSLAAAEAGAAILHLHARHPDGRPDQCPEGFAEFLPRIKQSTDAVVNITTGGSPYMSVEERATPAATYQPELVSSTYSMSLKELRNTRSLEPSRCSRSQACLNSLNRFNIG